MGARGDYEIHDFYCIKCGNKGMSLPRRTAKRRKNFHRKKLYCIYCKEEINHIECKTYEDVLEFKEKFERGEYNEEAENSLSYVRDSGIGQNNLY